MIDSRKEKSSKDDNHGDPRSKFYKVGHERFVSENIKVIGKLLELTKPLSGQKFLKFGEFPKFQNPCQQ